MNKKLNIKDSLNNTNKSKTHRLPCRGCIKNCTTYKYCNGKPWRMPDDDKLNKDEK